MNYVNIVPACKSCNCRKHSTDLEEWYKEQDFFSQERLDKIKEYRISFGITVGG